MADHLHKDDRNLELLQAEGELNQEIQGALKTFRDKLLESANPVKKEAKAKSNEQKEGP